MDPIFPYFSSAFIGFRLDHSNHFSWCTRRRFTVPRDKLDRQQPFFLCTKIRGLVHRNDNEHCRYKILSWCWCVFLLINHFHILSSLHILLLPASAERLNLEITLNIDLRRKSIPRQSIDVSADLGKQARELVLLLLCGVVVGGVAG